MSLRMRFHEFPRWAPAIAALGAAAGLAVLLAVVARTINRPPAIDALDVSPPSIAAGGEAIVHVSASDADGDPLRFEYKADAGRIEAEPTRPHQARYTAPVNRGVSDRVAVVVSDGRGLSSTQTVAVTITTAASPPPATPTPSPAPAEAAPPAVAQPPAPTAMAPSRRMRTATAAPAAPPTNHPPVLEQGYPIRSIGNNGVRIMATGHDPDDDPITHEWDGSGCFEIVSQSQTEAEVKFAEGCAGGTTKLTWTDSHGASASAAWPISK
jgi:Big-like domain-containing protein